jgi:hypothetical protein
MKVQFTAISVILTREPGDPKFYGTWAKGEHALLHYLRKWLNARGFNLIKKRLQDDGHLMGDNYQPYLRPPVRQPGSSPHIFIVSGFYALRDANQDWNKEGKVELNVHLDVLGKQPDCWERIVKLMGTEGIASPEHCQELGVRWAGLAGRR